MNENILNIPVLVKRKANVEGFTKRPEYALISFENGNAYVLNDENAIMVLATSMIIVLDMNRKCKFYTPEQWDAHVAKEAEKAEKGETSNKGSDKPNAPAAKSKSNKGRASNPAPKGKKRGSKPTKPEPDKILAEAGAPGGPE